MATMIGKYVIVRTYSAGVHAGILAERDGKEVCLTYSRRIWFWKGAASLSELSQKGPADPDSCKFPAPIPEIVLTEAIEIIPCSEVAKEVIQEVPSWTCR